MARWHLKEQRIFRERSRTHARLTVVRLPVDVLSQPDAFLLFPRVEEDEYIITTDTDQDERRHEIHERKDRYPIDHTIDEEAHTQRETGTDDDEQGDGNTAQVENSDANDQNSGDQHEQHV